MASMRGAVRSAQPVRVSQSPSDRERRAFLKWLEGQVSEQNYNRVIELDDAYRSTAIELGLMSRPNMRQIRRQEIQFERGQREMTPEQLERYLRSMRIRRPSED